MAEKFYDSKFTESCLNIVMNLARQLPARLVVTSLLSQVDVKKQINPKPVVEVCNFIARLIESFTLRLVPL